MNITATASGGFTGQVRHYRIDTATSPAGPALEAALAGSGFYAAAAAPRAVHVGADLPRWTITVADGGRLHTLAFAEDGNSPWQALLDRIRTAA